MTIRKIREMIQSGFSSNVTFYAESGSPPGYVWAEVCRNDYTRGRGSEGLIRRRVPVFAIRVVQEGNMQITPWFTYQPKTRPRTERLPARTVTRLVRQKLAVAS